MVGEGMRSLWSVAILVALAVVLDVGCSKGDPQKCEQALRNYTTLVFWKKADAEIAAAPPEKRAELRKQKLAEYERDFNKGLETLVTQCVSANNDEQVKCMIDAKTAEEAKACTST
jgi:hypothetical protein